MQKRDDLRLNTKSVLASYATFKELYKSKKYKSPYQILSEFIRYVIASRHLPSFTSTKIQDLLTEEFGFHLPVAVIRTALRNIDEVGLEHQEYTLKQNDVDSNAYFLAAQQKSEDHRVSLMDALTKFIKLKDVVLDEGRLEQELIAFVLNEDGSEQYQKVIGEFILSNKDNPGITDALSTIQEGSILYTGLTYNISELGSLKTHLTLFLDTEILFDIAGLNGELYRILADDFLKLVDSANRGGKLITLRYFSDAAVDIDSYYRQAEKVLEGKGEVPLNHAMREIIKGCKDISDIADKKTDLYRKIQTDCGIREDDKKNYYGACDHPYNLEAETIQGFPYTDPANSEGFRFCSHINVLRKGEETTDFFSSKFLFVTETRRVLEISRAIAEQRRNTATGEIYCGYAVSLSRITNLLWYKMNRGFGSADFPQNLDAVIKARIILSGYISQGVKITYEEIKEKYKKGELSQEQAAAYIVTLKGKSALPEELDSDNVEDNLDFSEEYFKRFAETISLNEQHLKDKDDAIKVLSGSVRDLEEKLSQANEDNQQKNQQIDDLTERIKALESREAEKVYRKKVIVSRMILACSFAWKILLIIGAVWLTWYTCKIFNADFGTWLSIVIGLIGIAGLFFNFFSRDITKHKERCEKARNKKL